MKDIELVQVRIVFADGSAQLVPLTKFQAQFLLANMGFIMDPETGIMEHFTDKALAKVHNLEGAE